MVVFSPISDTDCAMLLIQRLPGGLLKSDAMYYVCIHAVTLVRVKERLFQGLQTCCARGNVAKASLPDPAGNHL